MDTIRNVDKTDIGRIISVPVFTFFMIINIYPVWRDISAFLPLNTIKAIGLIHHLLLISFYALVILLYFLRNPARSTNRSFATNTIAVLATFLPFTLPILSGPALINPALVIIGDLVIVLGMVLSIYSLYTLGRSFSIIPQARKLVQIGPYRLVRHPLYLGEMISVFGLVISGFMISTMIIYLLFIICQIYRALQEEKLLTAVFPEYKEYCLKTARFIPGLQGTSF